MRDLFKKAKGMFTAPQALFRGRRKGAPVQKNVHGEPIGPKHAREETMVPVRPKQTKKTKNKKKRRTRRARRSAQRINRKRRV
jgi:hypothetical protein